MNDQQGKEFVLQAKEYAQRIPLLLSEHSNGRVHSIFQNGVNIQMGGRLFFIGTTKNGQLPFGMHVSGNALQYVVETVAQDGPVHWNADMQQLVFQDNSIAVSLADAVSFQWELPSRKMEAADLTNNVAMLISILMEESLSTGLDVNITEFVTAYLEGEELTDRTVRQVKELLAVLPTSDEKGIEAILRFFIGRGKGLTPSGDDHLVGILAIHKALGLLSNESLRILHRLVVEESLTTDVSREYMLYALEGRFSSTVVKTASVLTQPADLFTLRTVVEELLDMGHSSGIDTIFGMLLGLFMQRRK